MHKYASPVAGRREAILQLVHERPVGSQEEMQKLLNQRGFEVTQPTLSRDLQALGIAKAPSGYFAPDTLLSLPVPAASLGAPAKREEKLNQALREFAASITPAGSLVVLRTPSAGAQPLARAIDEAALLEVAGTLAGDDTVFVAAKSGAAARKIVRRFSDVLQVSRSKRRF